MSEKEKIFAGEQFFHDDLFSVVEFNGTAFSGTEFGPFDWQEVQGRLKVVAEIFEAGNGKGTVSVTIQGSNDGTSWTDVATGTVQAGDENDAVLPVGKFLEYVAVNPDYKYGKVKVTAPATITSGTLKVGLAAT